MKEGKITAIPLLALEYEVDKRIRKDISPEENFYDYYIAVQYWRDAFAEKQAFENNLFNMIARIEAELQREEETVVRARYQALDLL